MRNWPLFYARISIRSLMFGLFKKDSKQDTTIELLKQMKSIMESLKLDQDHRFSEVKAHLSLLEQNIRDLEGRLLSKELKDRQQFGQIHYKLHEVKPTETSDDNGESLKKNKLKN